LNPAGKNEEAYVSINANPNDLLNEAVFDLLKNVGEKFPRRLSVELTEWRDNESNAGLAGRIEKIRKHGVLVSIDDFGVGYSSSKTIRSIEFDIIKIDASLVASGTPADTGLIKWALERSAEMGAKVVAEGVETLDIFDRVKSIDVDALQGWYIDKIYAPHLVHNGKIVPNKTQPTTAC